MFTHTAVTSRNAVKQLIRSMNGTILSSTLTLFLSPVPSDAPIGGTSSLGFEKSEEALDRGLHLRAVRRHQVDDMHRHLVDVIDDMRGLTLEQREAEQTDQRGTDTERGAVE